MKGRDVLKTLTADDQPALNKHAESVLEIDKLFWLDKRNAKVLRYVRMLVPGEELPFAVPAGQDAKGVPFAMVEVTRKGRLFIVQGKPVLFIQDNKEVDAPKKKEHTFLSMGEIQARLSIVRKEAVTKVVVPDVDRVAVGTAEKERVTEKRFQRRLRSLEHQVRHMKDRSHLLSMPIEEL